MTTTTRPSSAGLYSTIAPPHRRDDCRPVAATVRDRDHIPAQLDPTPIPHVLTPAQIQRHLDARLAFGAVETRELARILALDFCEIEGVRQ